MASSTHRRRNKLQSLVTEFDDSLRLTRASELASRGHLLEAEALLCPGMHAPMSSDELDLLARIHVKQGLFELALRRWEDALKTGNRRAEFEECIKALDHWLEYRRELWIWRARLGLYLAAILLSFWLLCRLGLSSLV